MELLELYLEGTAGFPTLLLGVQNINSETSYALPDLRRPKPHQPLNKWEGKKQIFPFEAHSHSNAMEQDISCVWNWFGMRQRRKKHVWYKLMVTTNWIRQVPTILETNENV